MLVEAIERAVSGFANLENPNVPISGANVLYGDQRKSKSGEVVGTNQALSYSPVWAAVSHITADTMKVPWLTYKRSGKTTTFGDESLNLRAAEASDRPSRVSQSNDVEQVRTANGWTRFAVSRCLRNRPSGRRFRIGRSGLNGFTQTASVSRKRAGENTTSSRSIRFVTHCRADARELHMSESQTMICFVLRGLLSMSWRGFAWSTLRGTRSGDSCQQKVTPMSFFANSAVPQGWFEHPGVMTVSAQKRFLQRIMKRHGRGSRHGVGILEEGMRWNKAGITPRDAMLIDLLKFGPIETARFFKLPLHKVGDVSRQGYNTTEAENASYHNETLCDWFNRLECEGNDKLFTEREILNEQYYTEF